MAWVYVGVCDRCLEPSQTEVRGDKPAAWRHISWEWELCDKCNQQALEFFRCQKKLPKRK